MLDRADEHALSSLCNPGRVGRPLRQEETLVLAVLEDAVEITRLCPGAAKPSGGPRPSSRPLAGGSVL